MIARLGSKSDFDCGWMEKMLICNSVSKFVRSEDGVKTQKKVWNELKEKLERIQPGILQSI
jgi:hypothetical protein